jgi:hypothetical protein
MEFAYTIGGGAPHVKKFIVDSAAAIIAGVPLQSNMETADADGCIVATTTTCVGCLGVSLDAGTTTAGQLAGHTGDNAAYISTIINPDAVFRAKLSGAAAEDTAITLITQDIVSTTGLGPGSSVTDEFVVWGYEGANEGIVRRATDTDTVVIAFPYDIAVGDTFLETSTNVADAAHWPTLSTLTTQVRTDAAIAAANDNFTVVEQQLRGISESGQTNSFTFLVAASHAFGQVGTLAT